MTPNTIQTHAGMTLPARVSSQSFTPMVEGKRKPPAPDTFEDQAIGVVTELRQAMLDLFASVGAEATQPQEVSRSFGLDKTLTWRISRTLGEQSVWDAVLYMPRRPSIVLLTQSLKKAGAPQQLVARVLETCDAFEAFVQTRAGDRQTFEIMVAGQAQREGLKRLEQFRRDGFAAASAVWGVSAKIHLTTRFVLPSAQAGRIDLMTVCGFVGFRRLRPNLPWPIAQVSGWHYQDRDRATPTPLSCCDQTGAPVMRIQGQRNNFAVRSSQEGRNVRFILESGHIGTAASTDVLLGWILRDAASQHAAVAGEPGEHGVFATTPSESLVHDVLIHESLDFAKPYEAAAYSMLASGPGYPSPDAEEGRLPVPTDIIDIGRADMLHLTGFPAYATTLQTACASVDRALSEFRAYRVSVTYPPAPALFVQRHSLLDPR
jgi:hypothetical protein